MIKRTIKKILRIILALLSCVCLFVVPVSASDSITYDIKDFTWVDPNQPNLMGDIDIGIGTDFAKMSSYVGLTTNNIYNNTGYWLNFMTDKPYYFSQNTLYYLETYQRLYTDIPRGVYDITLTLEVPDDFELSSNVTLGLYTYESEFVSSVTATKKVYTDAESNDLYSQGAFYTLQFKNVDVNANDIGLLKLQFYGYCTTEYGKVSIVPQFWELTEIDQTKSLLSSIIEFIKGIYNGIIDLPNKIANSISGFFTWIVDAVNTMKNAITNALTTLGNFIIDGLKSLFIPNDGFFTTLFNDLYNFFDEKLGVLMFPFDLIGTVLNRFLSITDGTGVISIPNVNVMNYTIISATTYDLKGAFTQILGNYYSLYYAFVDVIFVTIFINAIRKKFDEITRGNA